MTNEEKENLRYKIKDLLAISVKEIALMEENSKPITPENSIGRVSRMDAINNKGVADAALRNKKNKIIKLEKALQQIDKEGFGLCQNCGQAIQAAKLMFLPESTQCIRCASR